MLQDIFLIALVIAFFLGVPLAYLLWRRSRQRNGQDVFSSGRQLVMEGDLKMVVHGEIVSLRGHRPILYPVTCVYLTDGRNCTIFDIMLVRFPPGTRIAIWRDRSNDRYSIERYREQ